MRVCIGTILFVLILIFCACAPPTGTGGALGEKRSPFDPDLYSWKTASWTPFTVTDTISGFAYGKVDGTDRYVAVARTGVIAWSDNGDIWHKAAKYIPVTDPPTNPANVPDPFAASFNAVVFGGGVFVAVANDGKIARSRDGINWTAAGHSGGIAGFGTEHIMGICWGKEMFVAVGGNSNVSYSTNGQNWTGRRADAFGGSQLNDIAFDAEHGRFYLVGDDGKRGYSNNPAANPPVWNYSGPEHPFYTNHIRKVTVGRYGDHIGIGIVFNEWSGRRTAIATNVNFDNFDADLDAFDFGDNTINGIAWGTWDASGTGCFAAAGASAMIGWWPSAEPGNNSQRYWRALSFTEFRWWEITALAALKDRFFAGGIGGKIGYSK